MDRAKPGWAVLVIAVVSCTATGDTTTSIAGTSPTTAALDRPQVTEVRASESPVPLLGTGVPLIAVTAT